MSYEYGLMTGNLKEKEIVNIFNAKLENFFRNNPDYNVYRKYHFLKHKHIAGTPANPNAIKWDYDYEYNMSHKYYDVYITMYPNTSPDGRMKFNIPEVKWNLSIIDLDFYIKTEVINEKNPEIPDMIDFLLNDLPFKTVLIQKYENFMERL